MNVLRKNDIMMKYYSFVVLKIYFYFRVFILKFFRILEFIDNLFQKSLKMGKKVAAFRIIYESASNVYAPNQTVHGTVHIDLKKSIEAINVTLHVLGKAHTRWSCHKHGSA